MILSGTSILIVEFFLYPSATHDLILCFYFLLAVGCWITGIDALVGRRCMFDVYTVVPSNKKKQNKKRIAVEMNEKKILEEDEEKKIEYSLSGKAYDEDAHLNVKQSAYDTIYDDNDDMV